MRSMPVLLIYLALAAPAFASDGVVEINHASALAGGITPLDSPGYPVTLTLSGSYRLTGNLSSPLNVIAIDIGANNVNLDLSGFLVGSTNVCTGYPTSSCAVSFGNAGIRSSSQFVTVRNGNVTGMAGTGVDLSGAFSEVSNLKVFLCGADGISIGDTGQVIGSTVHGNRSVGINLRAGGSAEDNLVRANGDIGIWGQGTRLGVKVSGNRVYDNANVGILLDTNKSLVTRNLLTDNPIAFTGGVSLNDNVCGNTTC